MHSLQIGSGTINVFSFTGKVANASKNMETKVSGSGGGGFSYQGTGGNSSVRITSKTIVHDQLFLVDEEGNERSFQLQDFNVACRESNTVTVMWGILEGKENGPYFRVFNHTTNSDSFNDKKVWELVSLSCSPIKNKFLGCTALIALFIVCCFIPILFLPLIGYIAYFNLVVIKGNIKKFKSELKIPTSN